MKHVVFVVPALSGGGVHTASRYAAKSLSAVEGYRVTLLALDCDWSLPEASFYSECGLGSRNPEVFLRWIDHVDCDLVFTNDVPWLEPAFPYLPKNVKHVVVVHDTALVKRASAIDYARYIDGVVCVGSHMKEVLERDLQTIGHGRDVVVIPNGVDSPDPGAKGPSKTLRLVFFGRNDPLKGAYDYLQLLPALRREGVDFRLKIIGPRDEYLRRLLEKKGFGASVEWLGWLDHEDCYGVLANCDVFFNPSRKESFGMVTAEAMVTRCVPIAYDIPSGNRDLIVDGESGYLVPIGSIKNVAKIMGRLYNDRGMLTVLGDNARRRVLDNFSAKQCGARYAVLCEQLGARSSVSPDREINKSIFFESKIVCGKGYQKLPDRWRRWVRVFVGRRPILNFILQNRDFLQWRELLASVVKGRFGRGVARKGFR